jgi:hypothetical protein
MNASLHKPKIGINSDILIFVKNLLLQNYTQDAYGGLQIF